MKIAKDHWKLLLRISVASVFSSISVDAIIDPHYWITTSIRMVWEIGLAAEKEALEWYILSIMLATIPIGHSSLSLSLSEWSITVATKSRTIYNSEWNVLCLELFHLMTRIHTHTNVIFFLCQQFIPGYLRFSPSIWARETSLKYNMKRFIFSQAYLHRKINCLRSFPYCPVINGCRDKVNVCCHRALDIYWYTHAN